MKYVVHGKFNSPYPTGYLLDKLINTEVKLAICAVKIVQHEFREFETEL